MYVCNSRLAIKQQQASLLKHKVIVALKSVKMLIVNQNCCHRRYFANVSNKLFECIIVTIYTPKKIYGFPVDINSNISQGNSNISQRKANIYDGYSNYKCLITKMI